MSDPGTDQAQLRQLLQLAYSAERAASFAYQGHARSVTDTEQRAAIQQIEADEWHHRDCVLAIMAEFDVSPSPWLEAKYWIIGQFISMSCYVIGWFMPMYFAGRLESGNVNEYITLKRLLHDQSIHHHDTVVDQMAQVEKDHEVYFSQQVTGHWMLPLFQFVFRWGPEQSYNDLPNHPFEE